MFLIKSSFRFSIIRISNKITIHQKFFIATDAKKAEDVEDFELSVTPEIEEAIEKKEKFRETVEINRNVSRFSKISSYQNYQGILPNLSTNQIEFLKKPKHFRKLYSRFGKSSGIESSIAWPSSNELEKIINEESQYDLTLEHKINAIINKKRESYEALIKMEKETIESLKKMPKQLDAFYQRIIKKGKLKEEKKAKQDELLEKAREFYGYEVDLRDERVKNMISKFEEERKAELKLKKKNDDKKRAQNLALSKKLNEAEKLLNSS